MDITINKELLKAEDLFRSGDYINAKKILETFLRQNKESVQLYNLLGLISIKQNLRDEANDHFKKGLSIDPENISLLKNLSLNLKSQKKFIEANKCLKTLYRLSNESETIVAELTDNLLLLNKKNEAYEFIKNSLNKNNNSELLNITMANTLFHIGKEKKSINFFKKTLAINQFNFQALFTLSYLKIKSEDYKKAIFYLEKIIINKEKYEPYKGKFSIIYYNLGYAYNKLKKIKEAEKYYLLSLDLNPNELSALVDLSNIYLENNYLDKAIDFINKAIDLYPDNRNLYNNLSQIYSQMGNHPKAVYYRRLGSGVIVFKSKNEYGLFELS